MDGMAGTPLLSPVGEIVRKHDPDRFFTALFAPAARREALFTLYAFNHELARAREVAREPMAALIRLQWWREVVEGARRRHEVAGPLGAALDAGELAAADLADMVEAREAETEPVETLAAFEAYVHGSAGSVMVAAGRTLGMADPEVLRPWGAGCGIGGVLRNVPALARQGRCVLPHDLLRAAGLSEGAVLADPGAPSLAPVKDRLTALATAWFKERPIVPRSAVAAVLPAVFGRRDVKAWRGVRTVGDKLAVTLAALRGHV